MIFSKTANNSAGVMNVDIALVGAPEEARRYLGGLPARALRRPEDAVGGPWDILALSSGALHRPLCVRLRAKSLLLPGDSGGLVRSAGAEQLVGYGLSPRHTLTLSSLTGGILCLQRSVLAADGTLLEPQELPLPAPLAGLPPEQALLLAGVLLLTRRVGA